MTLASRDTISSITILSRYPWELPSHTHAGSEGSAAAGRGGSARQSGAEVQRGGGVSSSPNSNGVPCPG